MSVTILQADTRALPLPDNSVDLIVSSPPYWSLRSYTDGGEHYDGQIGAEDTPAQYVDALVEATREWMRVVKPSGSIWVNLGDKYSGAQQQSSGRQSTESSSDFWRRTNPKLTGIPTKSLMGLPWRYALRCIDDLGLILRAEVVWSKPNGMPESVTDRVRRSHEQWFHLTLSPRYYSAVDEVREPTKPGQSPSALSFARPGRETAPGQSMPPHRVDRPAQGLNPLGKLPGSVWTIPTEPLNVPESLGTDHYAAFPSEWPRRIVTGWSPREVCTACGEGRRPVMRSVRTFDGQPVGPGDGSIYGDTERRETRNKGVGNWRFGTDRSIDGHECACPDTSAPATPGVVLDPFGGTGTTALVADVLGRHGISVDASRDYCRIAQWRCTDPKQRAKAARRPFTPPVQHVDGQAAFTFGEASA